MSPSFSEIAEATEATEPLLEPAAEAESKPNNEDKDPRRLEDNIP